MFKKIVLYVVRYEILALASKHDVWHSKYDIKSVQNSSLSKTAMWSAFSREIVFEILFAVVLNLLHIKIQKTFTVAVG